MIDDRVIKTEKVSYACYTWRADHVVVFYHYGTPLAVYNEKADRLWVTVKRWSQTSTRQRRAWTRAVSGPHTSVQKCDHWKLEQKILEYRLKCVNKIIESGQEFEPHDEDYDAEIERASLKAAARQSAKFEIDEDKIVETVTVPITRQMIESGEVGMVFVVKDDDDD